MTKPNLTAFQPVIGIILILAGALTLVLAFFNYLQDGRISSSVVIGLLGISAGMLFYSHAKKQKAQSDGEKSQ